MGESELRIFLCCHLEWPSLGFIFLFELIYIINTLTTFLFLWQKKYMLVIQTPTFLNWLLEFGSGTDYVAWAQTPRGKSSVLYRLPPLWTPASSSWGFQATHTSDQSTTNWGVPRIPSGSIIYLEWFTELGKCYTYKKYISGTTKWRDIQGEMWEILDTEFLCSSPHRIREHHPLRAHRCIHQPRAPPSLGAQSFYWGSSKACLIKFNLQLPSFPWRLDWSMF